VKETNDAAVRVLASLLAVHLTFILKANTEASADATAVIAEESNTKLVIRRTLLSITGSVLWNVDAADAHTHAIPAFSTGILKLT
jgi:hypothetical protein